MTIARLSIFALLLAAGAPLVFAGESGCPPGDEILERLSAADPERGSRAARFGQAMPGALYRRAARRPGRPVSAREGNAAFGVMAVELPVSRLWRAVSDEEHFALDGFLPIERSEVIGGEPRGSRRVVFQTFDRLGVGRWWVSEIRVNDALFAQSGGELWEAYWEDRIDGTDVTRAPVSDVAGDLSPLVETHGAWLLVPVGESCTVIDYFVFSDPGGIVGAMQWLMAERVLRATMRGVVRMAGGHVDEPHEGKAFSRPDGTPLP